MSDKRRLLKYGAFLVGCWTGSVCLLFILSANNDVNPLSQKPCLPFTFDLPSNQIAAFRFVRYNPEKNNKPYFSFSFDNLLVENNKLGIFKSALHRVVRISNLDFKTCQYPENNPITPARNRSEEDLQDLPSTNNIFSQARCFIEQLLDKQDGWGIDLNITFANVSELVINNFSYSLFSENDLVLSIQSKRAIASYSSSGLILRGHVIIKTGRGDVLEGNHIKWDIDNNTFAVQGVYALNQNGTVKSGKDVTLDHALNEIIPEQTVKCYQKEEPKCFAKL
jgi:hypothetical protein